MLRYNVSYFLPTSVSKQTLLWTYVWPKSHTITLCLDRTCHYSIFIFESHLSNFPSAVIYAVPIVFSSNSHCPPKLEYFEGSRSIKIRGFIKSFHIKQSDFKPRIHTKINSANSLINISNSVNAKSFLVDPRTINSQDYVFHQNVTTVQKDAIKVDVAQ